MRVLITGGSGGLGSAVARRIAERGGWPIVCCHSRIDEAQRIVDECATGEVLRLDLRRPDLGRSVPPVDAVIQCAGENRFHRSLLSCTDEQLQDALEINTFGPLRVMRALASNGSPLRHAVFVLSTAITCRGAGTYAVAKTATLAICKLLHHELRERDVCVDAIVPGWMETPLGRLSAQAVGRSIESIREEHIGGRLILPDEVAELCASRVMDPPGTGRVVLWDRRLSKEPIFLSYADVLAFDRLPPAPAR